jgi:hypothetical protein
MAACFRLDLDSDTLSNNILAPPANQARSTQALASRIRCFSHISRKKAEEQKRKSQKQIENDARKKSQVCILLESDSHDNLLGYRPPPI